MATPVCIDNGTHPPQHLPGSGLCCKFLHSPPHVSFSPLSLLSHHLCARCLQAGSLGVLIPPATTSCEGFCGGQAPAGCFCDDLCTFYDDCCPDAVELCLGGGSGTPPATASCEGFCGGQAPAGCFCDDLCTAFNDCCPDAVELCGLTAAPSTPAPPISCEGFCGGGTPFGCFCDDVCTAFGDCCPDYLEVVRLQM